MLEELRTGLATWWSTLTPEFAFLLVLPFVVGALGLLGDWVRRRRHKAGLRSQDRRKRDRETGRWQAMARPRVKRH